MRRLLGNLLPALLLLIALVTALGGCGDAGDDTVTDTSSGTASDTASETAGDEPAPTAGQSPDSAGPGEPVDFDLVQAITLPEAGGSVSDTAVALGDDEAVQEFTAQFENDAMGTKVQNAVNKTDVPDDELLYGAVVAVGCDSPDDVSVTSTDRGLVVTPVPVANPQQECFAPMTTVALVLVPASSVS